MSHTVSVSRKHPVCVCVCVLFLTRGMSRPNVLSEPHFQRFDPTGAVAEGSVNAGLGTKHCRPDHPDFGGKQERKSDSLT